MTRFEWDLNKDAINRHKHGISFAEASAIFDGPVLTAEDEGPYDEIRERSYGMIGGIVVVCVIHTERQNVTRIISARKATKNEQKQYNEYLRKAHC